MGSTLMKGKATQFNTKAKKYYGSNM